MFEEIQLIYMSVRILKFWALLYDHNWRRYLCLSVTLILLLTQLGYMFLTVDGIDAIIRNAYMFMLWFNTFIRAILLLYYREKYEKFIGFLTQLYEDLKQNSTTYVQELLNETNNTGKYMARGNLFLGVLTCIGFASYPLFVSKRVLPFGSIIPGIDEISSPFYEFWYTYEMIITPIGCCMYIPFTSLIVAFIMFGIVMSKTLQHQLRNLKQPCDSPAVILAKLIVCIKYQKKIIKFTETVNQLTTYIFLLEFIAFRTLLCALLFLLIVVDSAAQAVIVSAYITMILAQIFALYWYANELCQQSLNVATAAYDTEWFQFEIPAQKCILLLILRAQKPCSIMVGNTYPMSLRTFQSMLNASYSYFTLLKRVYA